MGHVTALGGTAVFPVNMDVRSGHRQRLLDAVRLAGTCAGTQEVQHHGGRRAHRGGTQWSTQDSAHVVFKLRARTRLDGVVPGVMHARGQLVDHRAISIARPAVSPEIAAGTLTM